MKTLRIFLLAGLSVAVAGLNAHAALLNLSKDSGSPYFADFTANSLNVYYTYSGSTGPNATGSGTFRVFNPYSVGVVVPKGESYESSSASEGTGAGIGRPNGFNTLGPLDSGSFFGSYDITATISVLNGVASLSGGTVSVYGDLLGGGTGNLLLQGSLKTGLGGTAFGYVDPSGNPTSAQAGKYDLFEFIFDVTGGNSAIVADYMGLGGTGGIILDANFDVTAAYGGNNGLTTTTLATTHPTIYQGFNGDWTKNFSNPLNAGVANTFVPEPSAYPLMGGVMAVIVIAVARRKSTRKCAALN